MPGRLTKGVLTIDRTWTACIDAGERERELDEERECKRVLKGERESETHAHTHTHTHT